MLTLNAKVSLAICGGFICGATWLLDRVVQPTAGMNPAPLTAVSGPVLVEEPMPSIPAPRPTRDAVRRFAFAQPSAVERASLSVREAPPRLVVKTPSAPETVDLAVLPPRALPPAATEELTPEAAPAVASSSTVAPSPPPTVIEDAPTRLVAAARVTRHRVAAGETLAKIARNYWGSSSDDDLRKLVAANPSLQRNPDRIFPGQELVIPVSPEASPLARSVSGETEECGARAVAAAMEDGETSATRWYTIQKRDSLSSIARRFLNNERRWVEIKRLNDLKDGDRIVPGMRIKLPPAVALAS